MAQVYDTVNISGVKLCAPRSSKASAACKTAYITGSDGGRLSIQTPVMKLPWDIKPKQMDETSNVSASLSLSFAGDDDDTRDFKNFLHAFDQHVKTLAKGMHESLGKKADPKVIEANFKESVKESNNGDYPPTFQSKIWLKQNEGGDPKCVDDFTMDVTVYDMKGNRVEHSDLKKGCPAAAIIQPMYVWCSTMGLGITWVTKQCIVKPMVSEGFAFKLGPKFDKYTEDDEPVAKKAKTESVESTSEGSSSGEDPLENEEF